MHRIATREAFRRMRRERVALEVELDEATVERTSDVESSVAERSDVLELLPELVAGIPPASRAVVLLHYWEDLSLEKVAEVLDLPLGTAKSRLSYGLAALRRMADRVHRENGARTPGRAR
jgi:RNA polymerase sigma-70 factor (ECF subfamily)